MMDEETLRDIEKRANAATPGLWEVEGYEGEYGMVYGVLHRPPDAKWPVDVVPCGEGPGTYGAERDDAEFIAHAREDVPALIAEVRRLLWRVRDLQTQREQDLAARRGELTRGPWTP